MKNGEIKLNKSPKISENGGSSCIDQYQAHQRVDMWHLVQRHSKLHHKPNKHIPPHHFTPVTRENKKEYKVWINNNK